MRHHWKPHTVECADCGAKLKPVEVYRKEPLCWGCYAGKRALEKDTRGFWLCVALAVFCLGCWLGHRAGYNQAQVEVRRAVK